MRFFHVKLYILLIAGIILNLSCGSESTGGPESSKRYFYVDPASGSDSNDGLTEGSPWKTIDKINSFTFQPGDVIQFKRGSTFYGGIRLNYSGNAANPIVFDAYGTGIDPVIYGSANVAGWVNAGGTVYSKAVTGYTPGTTGAGLVLENGTPLKFREWDTDAATSLGAETGVYTYDPADLTSTVLYVRCTDSSNPSSKTMRATHYLFGIHGDSVSYIEINNLHFREFSCHGITVKNCSRITVRNCRSENTGGAVLSLSPLIYGGNGFEFTLNSSNCRVYDSEAVNIFDSGFSPQVFESGRKTSDTLFEDCTASKCGFAGIEISVLSYLGSSGESIENVTVRRCEVSDSGRGFSGIRYGSEGHGIRVKADTGAGTITGVNIEDSYIHDCESDGIYIGGESGTVAVTRSKIENNKLNGIECAGIAGATTLKLKLTSSLILNNNHSGLTTGIGYNVVDGNGFEIINNTFASNSIGFYIGVCGGSGVLKNNIFYGTTAHLYTLEAVPSADFDYNCFYDFGDGIVAYEDTAYDDVSSYSSATSLDTHSTGSDPMFLSASDFHLQSGSPCKNSGTAAGVPLDYESQSFGTTPSMGAFR